jgi:hypothetical protein
MSRFGCVGVVSNIGSSPDGELQTRLQIKEGDGSMFKLFPNDALRWKTKTVSIEGQRLFQIVYT